MTIWNSTLKPGKPLVRKKPLMAKKPMARSRAPKMTASRKPKGRVGQQKVMLEACRGENCYLQVAGVCLGASGRENGSPVP